MAVSFTNTHGRSLLPLWRQCPPPAPMLQGFTGSFGECHPVDPGLPSADDGIMHNAQGFPITT